MKLGNLYITDLALMEKDTNIGEEWYNTLCEIANGKYKDKKSEAEVDIATAIRIWRAGGKVKCTDKSGKYVQYLDSTNIGYYKLIALEEIPNLKFFAVYEEKEGEVSDRNAV